jgi:oxygen-independent coproporphyrinogen-3 oxidase
MLRLRLRDGLPLADAGPDAQSLCAAGLVTIDGERVVLTLPGRLLADAVIRRLID